MANQVLKIGRHNDKLLLTKPQKDFNRLTKQIGQLRADIRQADEVMLRLRERLTTTLWPLQERYHALEADMVHILDRAHRSGAFKARERKKLESLILAIGFDLIANQEMEDVKEIYDRYSEAGYEAEIAEMEAKTSDSLKDMLEQAFGLNLDDDPSINSPEDLQALFAQQMAEAEQERAARRANRPKTQKQLEKEQKKAEEAQKISKSVRTVYLELVKAFHPDLEPEEGEKRRKTEVMQRITHAYESDDLLALLHLQLEFEQIDQEHLEHLADDRLRHFIKILRRQSAELQKVLFEQQQRLVQLTGQPMAGTAPLYAESLLEHDIKRMKKDLRSLEKDVQTLSDPTYLRAWLKDYRSE